MEDDTEEAEEEMEREPLTKKEVQQIANQLTKNSIEVLSVTSNSNGCMYDDDDDDGGGGGSVLK